VTPVGWQRRQPSLALKTHQAPLLAAATAVLGLQVAADRIGLACDPASDAADDDRQRADDRADRRPVDRVLHRCTGLCFSAFFAGACFAGAFFALTRCAPGLGFGGCF